MRSGVVADGEVIKMCGKIKDEAKQVCQLPRLPIRLRGDMNGTTNQWEIGKGKINPEVFCQFLSAASFQLQLLFSPCK